MRGPSRLAGLFAAIAVVVAIAGCGSSGSSSTSGGSTSGGGASSDLKVGIAQGLGGRSDQSFGQSAGEGVDRAAEELGVEVKELEERPSETDAAREERLRLLAQGGYNPVIAVGFTYAAALAKVAEEFPDTKFAIIDSTEATGANIANLTFAANQGSYLVGVAAALKSKTGKVGFIGGVNLPIIHEFQAGYEAGVKAADPQTSVEVKYLTQPPDFSGFVDPAKGKTAAEGMYEAGADVIYQAAGGAAEGVFRAAKDSGNLAIGVDSDQYKSAPADIRDVILTSMLKHVDVAVFDFIKLMGEEKFKSGELLFDLEDDGIGYSRSGGFLKDIQKQLDEAEKGIIDGTVTVPKD